MKHLYLVGAYLVAAAGALAVVAMPAVASAAAPKHYRPHHAHVRAHAHVNTYGHAYAKPPVRSAYGTAPLPRIPSMDPEFCDSPNVVTVESCRISSNGGEN